MVSIWTYLKNLYLVKEESSRKNCGKRRKCWLSAFSPFPTMFSTHFYDIDVFFIAFILSFVNGFNLDISKKFVG